MPEVRPESVALIAAIAGVLVQVVKGPLSEELRQWIPLVMMVCLTGAGIGLSALYGGDLVAGGIEGFFGAATSLGVYGAAKTIPGLSKPLSRER